MEFLSGKHSLEAAIVNMADEIAQRHHDIEDGIEYNLISKDILMRELSERRINQLEKAYYERFPKFHKSIEYFFKDIRNSILTVRKKGFLFKKIYGKIIVNILTTDLILNIIYNLEK